MTHVIANYMSSHLSKTPIDRDLSQSYGGIWTHSEVSKLYWNQVPKPPRTSNFNLNKIRRENHSSHLPRSQSALESSPKVFRNFKRLQVSEGLRIQVSKVVKNFHYNLRRQRTFKEQEEHSSKSFLQVSKF